MKQERNELCNCGSGKKYKKCCLMDKQHKISATCLAIRSTMNERELKQLGSTKRLNISKIEKFIDNEKTD